MVIIYFAAYVLKKKKLIRHMNSLFKNVAEKFVSVTVTFAAPERDKFQSIKMNIYRFLVFFWLALYVSDAS